MSALFGGKKNKSVEHLFPQYNHTGDFGNLEIHELPHLARPLIERIHDIQPQAVIAGDRGARLLAVAAMKSWRRRYPGERFPTLTGSIQMARITSRSAPKKAVRKAANAAFANAGLSLYMAQAGNRDGNSPKVVYMDDWAVYGGTAERFIEAAQAYGIDRSSLTYMTMCGNNIKLPRGVEHFVGTEGRDPRWSEWDTHDSSACDTYVGVLYDESDPVTPIADRNENAVEARHDIELAVRDYYQEFTAAVLSGQLTVGSLAR